MAKKAASKTTTTKKKVKKSEKFESDIKKLQSNKMQLEAEIQTKLSEAKSLMGDAIFSLLKDLVKDDALSPKVLMHRQRNSKEISFEIVFKEGLLINRQDVSDTLKDVKQIFEASKLEDQDNPVKEVR